MKYAQIEWNNGTPYSPEFGDVYFSASSGIDETRYVFLRQNRLPQRWQQTQRFVIAETGFGTGLNFIVTLQAWLASAEPEASLHYISIEKHPVAPADMSRLSRQWPELESYYAELIRRCPPPLPGMHVLEFAGGRVRLYLIYDDIEHALEGFDIKVDAWYLDGFAPSRNPAMWSERVFELIGRYTAVGGSFATYTAAGAVRRGLTRAGFVVGKAQGYGSKRDMLSGFILEQRCYVVEQPWFSVPAFSYRRKHAAVIGAGLAGLANAWALVKRGWNITLLDTHAAIARGASGNPAGLLMPRLSQQQSLDSRFYLNAYVHTTHCLDELQALTGDKFWFNSGNVLVDRADRLRCICESHQFASDFIGYIDSAATKDITGIALNNDVLFFADAGWVDVKRLCETLQRACGDSLTYRQAQVADMRFDRDTWHIVDRVGHCVLSTECVVVANGASARELPALQWLPLESVRGQLTIAAQTETSRRLRCGISAGRYMTPACQGRHVVGASYRLNDQSRALSAGEQQENIDGINRLVPGLLDNPGEQTGRVAYRAVSTDRVPVAGCVPDLEAFESNYHDLHHGRTAKHYPAGAYLPGLYVSTAHGSRGLASCFIAAELIASMVCGEPMPVEKDVVDYLNPARFIIRRLRRKRV